MSKEIKLAAMIGKSFQHKGTNKKYLFHSYKVKGDEVIVATDTEWFETTIYDLMEFINKFIEVPTEKATPSVIQKKQIIETPTNVNSLTTVQNETVTFLKDTLIDNIKKVKESADYIPQAKSISENVSVLINLARVEIEIKKKM